jgi:hypothetical protein
MRRFIVVPISVAVFAVFAVLFLPLVLLLNSVGRFVAIKLGLVVILGLLFLLFLLLFLPFAYINRLFLSILDSVFCRFKYVSPSYRAVFGMLQVKVLCL